MKIQIVSLKDIFYTTTLGWNAYIITALESSPTQLSKFILPIGSDNKQFADNLLIEGTISGIEHSVLISDIIYPRIHTENGYPTLTSLGITIDDLKEVTEYDYVSGDSLQVSKGYLYLDNSQFNTILEMVDIYHSNGYVFVIHI